MPPHYFAALAGHGDVTVADKIALGLQAGWDVEGVVREGHFANGRSDALSPDDLLDVDHLDFPAEMLGAGALDLAVGVAHHKPDGEPWARLVVFFVTIEEPAATNTAALRAGWHG